MTYIALLRGINIGGHLVKMDRLRTLFADLGFTNVRSYIQTGNVFFESPETSKPKLRSLFEKHLAAQLGFEVSVCLRTVAELERVLERNPFAHITVTPDIRLSITFLAEPAQLSLPVPYTTPDGAFELVAATPTELFVVWHLVNGRPGRSYGLMEKKLQVPMTVRFWHTTAKILAAAKGEK